MRMLYMTFPTPKEADKIGRTLVEERLVACVNTFRGMRSIYRWEGQICEDEETAAIAKTADHKVGAVISRIKELHSAEVPCVVSLAIETGNPDYLKWLSEQL